MWQVVAHLAAVRQIREGKLVALAVNGARRSSALPEVPTMAEQGLPDATIMGWYAFLAPAGVERAVMTKLNLEVTGALEFPALKEKLLALGAEP